MSSNPPTSYKASGNYGFWIQNTRLILISQYFFVLVTVITMVIAISGVREYFDIQNEGVRLIKIRQV